MDEPCLCGDPDCPRCFNTLIDVYAQSIQSDATPGSLWAQFQHEVARRVADIASDDADARAEGRTP